MLADKLVRPYGFSDRICPAPEVLRRTPVRVRHDARSPFFQAHAQGLTELHTHVLPSLQRKRRSRHIMPYCSPPPLVAVGFAAVLYRCFDAHLADPGGICRCQTCG